MSPVVAVRPEAIVVGGCAAVKSASVEKLPKLVDVCFVPLLLPDELPPLDELLLDEETPELELELEPLLDEVAPELELELELLDDELEESITTEAVEGAPILTPLPASESEMMKSLPTPGWPTNGIVMVLEELSPAAQVKVPLLGE
jgi:hypothetical protein